MIRVQPDQARSLALQGADHLLKGVPDCRLPSANRDVLNDIVVLHLEGGNASVVFGVRLGKKNRLELALERGHVG